MKISEGPCVTQIFGTFFNSLVVPLWFSANVCSAVRQLNYGPSALVVELSKANASQNTLVAQIEWWNNWSVQTFRYFQFFVIDTLFNRLSHRYQLESHDLNVSWTLGPGQIRWPVKPICSKWVQIFVYWKINSEIWIKIFPLWTVE